MKEQIEIIKNINIKNISLNELEDILPTLGMNGENLNEMPGHLSEFYGKGLKFWQYPNQFSKYLKQISTYNIESYLEIGCRWGGTFIITSEFLKLINKNVKSFACDIINISDILKEYNEYNNFTYIHDSSFNLSKNYINQNVDLILIDGDHSYEGLKKDFDISMQFTPKYVAFHDIYSQVCPGVVDFWNEIKSHHKHFEYIDQYENVNGNFLGIGLIEL
jgi:hypothetical protein